MSEIYSIIHDKAYDAAKAKGDDAAFHNVNVLGADWNLVKGNVSNMNACYNPSVIDRGRSALTAIGFGGLCIYKGAKKLCNNIINSVK